MSIEVVVCVVGYCLKLCVYVSVFFLLFFVYCGWGLDNILGF